MASMTELFLDDHLVEMAASVTRTIHRPDKHRANPVMRPEKWWEGTHLLPYAALYDQEESVFKLWYRAGAARPEHYIDGHAAYTAYATSTDAVHWERPTLGVMDFAGRRDHSVLLTGGVSENLARRGKAKKGFILSVIPHPHPKDESEKYVCLFADVLKRGAYLGYSADGIHWRREPEPFWRTPIDPTSWGDDTVKSMIYDRLKRKWVMYRRVIPEESERMVAQPGDENWKQVDRYFRVFGYAESDNLKDWGNHQIVLSMDGDDPADTEAYWLTCYSYEQVYVGYLAVYHMAPGAHNIDVQLVTSRDGIHFTRVCRREVFIPSGAEGYFDYMLVTGFQAEPIVVDDTVHLFYEAVNYAHDESRLSAYHGSSVGLATFPRDRFVSMQTGLPRPCRLVTKPFTIPHPKLFLNAATWGDGAIRVEALTRDWKPIEGFTGPESNVIKGDALAHPVRWQNNPHLGRLVGKEVRLRFCMTDARIHAMILDDDDRGLGTAPRSE